MGTWQGARGGREPWSLVLALVAVQGLLAFLYSNAVPIYQAPDEPQHVDMVLAVADLEGWTDPGGRTLSRQVKASEHIVLAERRHHQPRSAAEAPPRSERPSFGELPTEPATQGINHIAQHPPLYYALVASFVGVVSALAPPLWDASFDVVVALMRLWGALAVATLPALIFLGARRFDLPTGAALTAAIFPLAIPQLAHISGAVNNDNLLVPLFALLMVLCVPVMRGDTTGKRAMLVGLVLGLTLLSKGFAIVGIPFVAAAYLVGLIRRTNVDRRAGIRSSTLALVVGASVGGWWWIRNVVVHGALFPPGGIARPAAAPPGFEPQLDVWAADVYHRLIAGFWGTFGHLGFRLPGWVVLVMSAFVATGVVLALRDSTRRRSTRRTVMVLLLIISPTLVVAAGLMLKGWLGYAQRGSIAGMQGRYTFLGLAGVAIVVAYGWTRSHRVRPLAPLMTLSLAIVAQGVALWLVLDRYWGTPEGDGIAEALVAVRAWSPWPPWVLLVAAGCCIVLLLALVIGSTNFARGEIARRV